MLESLLEALQFSPNNIPLKLQIAKLYMQQGSFEEAEQQLIQVIDLDENHLEAKYELASCFYKQQKITAAEVLLEEIIKVNADKKYIELLCYCQINQENYSDAQEIIKVNADKKYIELLCYCQINQENYSDAQETYKELIELDPSYQNEDFDNVLKVNTTREPDFIDEDGLSFLKKPTTNFASIGGMEDIKKEIDLKIIKPLEHRDLYKAYGKKIGGGILLYGPPGCGKTHIARATAGEINANFISVGINDILDMWIGNSEKNLHEIFETARENTPCVIFIDEIDALGANRNDVNKTSGRTVINQFLAELDGIDADNDGILVLGATNAPWHLDPAFRRPGRFDRIIFVSPPDVEAKAAIYTIHLKEKPTETIDYMALARASKEFSGADIQAAIDVAIERKLEASFKDGIPKPLSTKDILKAIKKIKPSTKEWFVSSKNYALYANDSGLYDDILAYLNIKK